MKVLKSFAFEAFTHSKWVEKNYELFWILYLLLIWTVPNVVTLIDPYALSIVPLIAIIEIGFVFFDIIIEIFCYVFVAALKGRRLLFGWSLFLIPFLGIGVYLLFYSGSYFTMIVYLTLVVKKALSYFENFNKNESEINMVKGTLFGAFTLMIFLWSFAFAFIDWPKLGLENIEMNMAGSGLLVEEPHKGVATGICAFTILWFVKRKRWYEKIYNFL